MQAWSTYNSASTYKKTQQNQNVGKQNVIGAIQQASARTGVDFAYLLHKADQESSLNPNAQASTSSASGLFQFIKSTWLKMVKDHGAEYGLGAEANAITEKNGQLTVADPAMREKILNLRHDPVMSSVMAAEFTKENKDYLDASVGGTIGSTELYMAHFLGASGAAGFLKSLRATPNASAAETMPDAANANRSVFYDNSGRALSFSEIYKRFAAKFDDKSTIAAASQASASALQSRDMAAFSSAFYHAPAMPAADVNMDIYRDVIKQNAASSDTLFNTMILAQMHMNDALRLSAGTDERRL